ncbi:glycosyltransferase [Acidimicrobiaceae bacterium USS-CC1]|uniref:Glycosyltransferase n=1 Tax=Acidiferrimicrobium australe TaxID=2664430 RepID=A0ABW9QX12_9ACTN|nr:glycosyltransferase [Acidiferrimicrobium australe]
MPVVGTGGPTPPEGSVGSGPRGPSEPLVVIPTYREATTIGRVLDLLDAALPGVHVLVVDDGSPDGTAEVVRGRAGGRSGVHLLQRSAKRGLGAAYRTGFAWGLERGYGVFVEMDADLSHDPALVPALVDGLRDADLVIGSRYLSGGEIPDWAWYRRCLSLAGNRYAAYVLRLPLTDLTSGFRAYRAGILRAIDPLTTSADGYGFQIEMAYRAVETGARVVEVPIRFAERAEGRSKMSVGIAAEAFVRVTGWGIHRAAGGAVRGWWGGGRRGCG